MKNYIGLKVKQKNRRILWEVVDQYLFQGHTKLRIKRPRGSRGQFQETSIFLEHDKDFEVLV